MKPFNPQSWFVCLSLFFFRSISVCLSLSLLCWCSKLCMMRLCVIEMQAHQLSMKVIVDSLLCGEIISVMSEQCLQHTHKHTHTRTHTRMYARTHTHIHNTHICCQMHLISCAYDCKAWHCEHDPHIGHNTWERLLFGNNTPCSTSLTWHRAGFIMPETWQGPPQMGKTLSIFRICLQPSSQNNYCGDLMMQAFSTRCLSTVSL